MPLPPPAPPVPTPYIGVMTLPPPAVLNAQLGLKEGFGLVVGEVLPDSPAAKAGLQKYDVLTHLNDQQLVDAGQFSTLVRGAGKDSEVTLTVLRNAKEQKLPVKIGERLAPQRPPFPGAMDLRGQFEKWKGPAQDGLKKMQDRMKDYGERMRQYQERLKGWQKNPAADMPEPPKPPVFETANAVLPINPADILMQVQPGGTRQIRMLQPDGSTSYNTADVKLLMKDDGGEIEVSTKESKRMLLAKDANGETIFDGPIDTEEQRKALPEDIRKKIELIQVRTTASAVEAPFVSPADDVQ
jgi:serine protease Do